MDARNILLIFSAAVLGTATGFQANPKLNGKQYTEIRLTDNNNIDNEMNKERMMDLFKIGRRNRRINSFRRSYKYNINGVKDNNEVDPIYLIKKLNIPYTAIVNDPTNQENLIDLMMTLGDDNNKRSRRDTPAEHFRYDYPIETDSARLSVKTAILAKNAARSAAAVAKHTYRAVEDLVDEVAENGILKRMWKSFLRTCEDSWNYLFKWERTESDKKSKKFLQETIDHMKDESALPRGY